MEIAMVSQTAVRRASALASLTTAGAVLLVAVSFGQDVDSPARPQAGSGGGVLGKIPNYPAAPDGTLGRGYWFNPYYPQEEAARRWNESLGFSFRRSNPGLSARPSGEVYAVCQKSTKDSSMRLIGTFTDPAAAQKAVLKANDVRRQ